MPINQTPFSDLVAPSAARAQAAIRGSYGVPSYTADVGQPVAASPAPRRSSARKPKIQRSATPASQMEDAALWESFVQRGISKEQATRHVLLLRQSQNRDQRAEFLKDIDPGMLASFGLGAADMMSFGLGDQIARAIEPEAQMTQEAAQAEHPGAHLLGEVAGLAAPAGVAKGLTLLGRGAFEAPTIVRAAQGIRSTGGRALAKTAINATAGAGLAGAQAAGHTEGGIEPRLQAAESAAIPGAVVGAALPWVLGAAGAAGSRLKGVAGRVAGVGPVEATAVEAPVAAVAETPLIGGMREETIRRQLARQGFDPAAIDKVIAQARGNVPAATPRAAEAGTSMDVPTYQRRGTPMPSHAVRNMPNRPAVLATLEGPPTKPFVEPGITDIGDFRARQSFVEPSIRSGGRYTKNFRSRGAASQLNPEQEQALSRLLRERLENSPRPGHPIYRGGPAPTRSAEVRGGEPLTPSVAGIPGTSVGPGNWASRRTQDLVAQQEQAFADLVRRAQAGDQEAIDLFQTMTSSGGAGPRGPF